MIRDVHHLKDSTPPLHKWFKFELNLWRIMNISDVIKTIQFEPHLGGRAVISICGRPITNPNGKQSGGWEGQ